MKVNAQREPRWMQLRLGLSLWRQGKVDAAIQEAARAERSDEGYVRSAARMLLAAGDLAQGRRDTAVQRLDALSGHDLRFQAGVEKTKSEIGAVRTPVEGLRMLEAGLTSEDRSADAVTRSAVGVLREAARPAGTETAKRTDAR